MRLPERLGVALLLLGCGCRSSRATHDVRRASPPPAGPSPAAISAAIRARPYAVRVPSRYDGTAALPLVVLLHGYSASGAQQAGYFDLDELFESRGFLLAYPDGTLNRLHNRFWNATDACCDDMHAGVDNVAYVTAVIDDMTARYRVDPRRVYLMGHSNGGFMAHRMACERAPRVAAIVSLAGAVWRDAARCAPSEPVAVLDVHGTDDGVIRYGGGANEAGVAYPSARETVATWARLDRCGPFAELPTRFDHVLDLSGAETRVSRATGCAGGAVELWTMEGAGHIPLLCGSWVSAAYDWLLAHPKAVAAR